MSTAESGPRPSASPRRPSRSISSTSTESSSVGELLIRGQNIVAGYWNKPEQTADTFVDGWLHTGDLARVDDDGFVQIVDRMKDMVNRGGENVYCVVQEGHGQPRRRERLLRQVENALVQHPAVFEVAVMGVPDTMMGEKVGAVVVLRPDTEADAKEITDFARGLIADFKVPQFISFRPEPLPRNPGGKVLKGALRKDTRVGRPDPLRRRPKRAAAGAEIRTDPSTSRGRASARRSLRGSPARSA